MIDPKELRLGTLVSISPDSFDALFVVASISRDEIRLTHHLHAHNPHEIYGIPLTPQLLEKFGFEQKISNQVIQYEYDGFVMQEDADGFGLSPVATYWIRMSYVHQLMNQIFALTGHELEYNQKVRAH